MAENEEQYTLSNVICTKFQDCCFLFFEILLEAALKM